MCIASFVVSGSGLIVTFNRDEDFNRPFLAPQMDTETGVFCPKDELAGGTWIGLNHQYIMCLQNGGRIRHKRQLPYQQSRGVMLKDMLITNDVEGTLSHIQAIKTEPFTLSITDINTNELSIYYYDGTALERENISLETPMLVLSSPLYDTEAKKSIMADFNKIAELTPESVFAFHVEHKIGAFSNPFVKYLATSSITQFKIQNDKKTCTFMDLISSNTLYFNI